MNPIQAFANPSACCRAITVLYGISTFLTFAEKLMCAQDYSDQGWFSWKIFQFDRARFVIFRKHPQLMKAIFATTGMSVALTGGLIGVILALCGRPASLMFTAGVGLTVAALLLIQVRSVYGGDGSQQMNLIIGIALFLGFNPWVRPALGSVSLMFIAAQSCLAYATSGISKLVSPIWMKGDPLVGIMSTRAYGSPLALQAVSRLGGLRHPFAVSMVLMETIFPAALLLPPWGFAGILLWGVSFHISVALCMGLNTFLWSFLASYPALCYVWLLIHR